MISSFLTQTFDLSGNSQNIQFSLTPSLDLLDHLKTCFLRPEIFGVQVDFSLRGNFSDICFSRFGIFLLEWVIVDED